MLVGPALTKEVDWWKSEPTEALAKAKAQGLPILVFWTAAWCPECNELQSASFRSAVVQAELDRFIPILLDGDAAHGQVWGEKLVARGYPAIIVLSPSAVEITRIATGLSADSFASALKAARTKLTRLTPR